MSSSPVPITSAPLRSLPPKPPLSGYVRKGLRCDYVEARELSRTNALSRFKKVSSREFKCQKGEWKMVNERAVHELGHEGFSYIFEFDVQEGQKFQEDYEKMLAIVTAKKQIYPVEVNDDGADVGNTSLDSSTGSETVVDSEGALPPQPEKTVIVESERDKEVHRVEAKEIEADHAPTCLTASQRITTTADDIQTSSVAKTRSAADVHTSHSPNSPAAAHSSAEPPPALKSESAEYKNYVVSQTGSEVQGFLHFPMEERFDDGGLDPSVLTHRRFEWIDEKKREMMRDLGYEATRAMVQSNNWVSLMVTYANWVTPGSITCESCPGDGLIVEYIAPLPVPGGKGKEEASKSTSD